MSKSVLRALDILELIAKSEVNLTVTEIAKQLELPKSTTYGILKSLLEKGYISIKDKKLKTYKLGLNLFQIINTSKNEFRVNSMVNSYNTHKNTSDNEPSEERVTNFLLALSI